MMVFATALLAESTLDLNSLLIPLGPFAITAAVLLWWIADLRKQRDAERERVQTLSESVIPVLTEVRDVLRGATETIRGNTEAMNAAARAVERVPTEAEMTRVRDVLARLAQRDIGT